MEQYFSATMPGPWATKGQVREDVNEKNGLEIGQIHRSDIVNDANDVKTQPVRLNSPVKTSMSTTSDKRAKNDHVNN